MSVRDLRIQLGTGADRFTLGVPSIDIAPQQHTVIVGPSGCGKTTLLRTVIGILDAPAGTLTVGGQNVLSMSDSQRRRWRLEHVGVVFQSFALLDYLSGIENVLLPSRLLGRCDADLRKRAHELAERAGIASVIRRRPHKLSQGERQRVAICRALLLAPSVVVCDEPTGNLDAARSTGVMDLILDESHRTAATVIVATHDAGVIDRAEQVIDVSQFSATNAEAAASAAS
ncbi:MAG: ATP-binding cassette domain-containing protein [Planctomycetota bacterium]